jgi:hypothetical protein
LRIGVFLTCWKSFSSVLKEAGVELTSENQEKIDKIIHKYIGEQSSYGHCSPDWKKANKEIKANPEMRNELVSKIKAIR